MSFPPISATLADRGLIDNPRSGPLTRLWRRHNDVKTASTCCTTTSAQAVLAVLVAGSGSRDQGDLPSNNSWISSALTRRRQGGNGRELRTATRARPDLVLGRTPASVGDNRDPEGYLFPDT